MTTLASPSLGSSVALVLWEVEMSAGAVGPLHSMDREQVWSLIEGEVEAEVGDECAILAAGDTLVLAAGVSRRIRARTDVRFTVCGAAGAEARVVGEEGSRGVPAWIA